MVRLTAQPFLKTSLLGSHFASMKRDDLGVGHPRSPQLRAEDGYSGEDIWGLWVFH